jgi:hypothetical protein
MRKYDFRAIGKCAVVAILVMGLLMPAYVADVSADPAYRGAEDGKGEGVPPLAVGNPDRNGDPDDNGRGPERGDGTVDKEDWNHGCGNDEDREDDNEGICGPHKTDKPPAEWPPETVQPRKTAKPVCKVVLWGCTPELFPGWVNVRDPGNEKFVLAESHGRVEYVVERGTELQVLWWDDALGHGGAFVERFVCDGAGIVLVEPVLMHDMK